MKHSSPYLPKGDCVHRGLYRVLARNIKLAVYNETVGEFLGIREKFGNRFVDGEKHWDEKYFATCKPVELLPDQLPVDIEPIERLPGLVCITCGEPVQEEMDMETKSYPHLSATQCEEKYGCYRGNRALFDWLEKMAEKYLVNEPEAV